MKTKKTIIISLVIAVLVLAMAVLPACNEAKEYTVTFDSTGGSAVKSLKIKEGEKITRPSNPTKEMFTFSNWYSDKALTKIFNFDKETMPAKNITLYAGWIPEQNVMVRFNANGGKFDDQTTVHSAVYKLGEKVIEPGQSERPSFVGYQFGGWCTDVEGTHPFDFNTSLHESVDLYARWNDHSDYAYISYYGNGKLLMRFPFMKGAALQEHAVDLVGYQVDGWYTNPEMTQNFTLGTQIDANINLYAAYYTQGLVITAGKVVDYNGIDSDIVVPNVFDGQAVTAIGQYAFYRSSQFTAPVRSVWLPDSITTLEEGAFYGCDYLTEVNLTANVTSIGKSVFHGDVRLKSVGDISGLTAIPENAFLGCESLQSVTLPAGLTSIGAYAFADCKSLTSVTVPVGVTFISNNMFEGCTNLKNAVFATMAQITFGKEIFIGCKLLETITIQSAVCAEFTTGPEQSPFIDCNNAKILVRSNTLSSYVGRYSNLDGGAFTPRLQQMN